ncbi:MAG: porin family protein [Paludibacter sp.]|nr:porin family protein [Paludibacter sp.]
MRKFIFSLSVLALSLSVSAQFVSIPTQKVDLNKISLEDITFGFKIIPSISWVAIDHNDAQADGATLKLGLGATAEYEVNKIISIISGVNYNTTGGYMYDSLSLNTSTNKDNYKVSYSLIEVPLGIKLRTPEVNRFSYYLNGGFNAGFILSATEKHKSTVTGVNDSKYDILKLSSASMLGYFASVGTTYKIIKKIRLFGEITYKNALTSIANGNEYTTVLTPIDHKYTSPIYIYPGSMEFAIGIQF